MIKSLFSRWHHPSAMQEGTTHMTPAQEKAFRREGLRVVLGGILVHFVLGTFYLWGGISLYVASYLRAYNESVDIDLVKLVFPVMFIGINVTLPFGPNLANKIGHKLLCFLGVLCVALAPLIVSFFTNHVAFIILYTVMIGLGSGIVFMVPIVCGWKYFPHRKGLVSGAIIAGYGFGSFTFNLIALALVNPDNETATDMHDGHAYFTAEVYDRVPYMLRILSIFYLVLGLTGSILVKMPRTTPTEHHDEHDTLVNEGQKKVVVSHVYHECQSIKEGVCSSAFWLLFIIIFSGSFIGLLMANNYKVYGLQRLGNDSFVTLVGSIGSISNGCSKLLWAGLYDRFGFRKVYLALITLQLIIGGTLHTVSTISALYLIWYAVIMGCEGGHFSVMPAVSSKIFGPKIGPVIYGLLYIGFSAANMGSFLLTKFALKSFGWARIFWICFGLSMIAFIFNFIFKESYQFENKPGVKDGKQEQIVEKLEVPVSTGSSDGHDTHDTHEHNSQEEKHTCVLGS